MKDEEVQKGRLIRLDMKMVDILERYRQTEAVFRKNDPQAGVCLCCQALFESLEDIAGKYALNLDMLMADLETVARCAEEKQNPSETRIQIGERAPEYKPER
jgi:hypothetical protein